MIQLLIRAREFRNMSQSELARRMGLQPTNINRWERGVRNPTVAILERWALALGYDWELAARLR